MGDVLKFRPRPKPEGPQKTVDYDNLAYPTEDDLKAAMALAKMFRAEGMNPADLDVIELCGECMGLGLEACPSKECGFYRKD